MIIMSTLKWPRCFPPVGENKQNKTNKNKKQKQNTFPAEFCDEYYAIYLYTKLTIILRFLSFKQHCCVVITCCLKQSCLSFKQCFRNFNNSARF